MHRGESFVKRENMKGIEPPIMFQIGYKTKLAEIIPKTKGFSIPINNSIY